MAQDSSISDQRRLHVGNLTYRTTENQIRDYFEQFGAVEDVTLMREKHSNNSRGFGFVSMRDANDAKRAFDQKDHTIDGKNIHVSYAVARANFRTKKLHVTNIHPSITQEQFAEHFSQYGPSKELVIITWPSGESKEFGFAVYEDVESADRAMMEPDHSINGHKLVVQRTNDGERRGDRDGGRDAGRGGDRDRDRHHDRDHRDRDRDREFRSGPPPSSRGGDYLRDNHHHRDSRDSRDSRDVRDVRGDGRDGRDARMPPPSYSSSSAGRGGGRSRSRSPNGRRLRDERSSSAGGAPPPRRSRSPAGRPRSRSPRRSSRSPARSSRPYDERYPPPAPAGWPAAPGGAFPSQAAALLPMLEMMMPYMAAAAASGGAAFPYGVPPAGGAYPNMAPYPPPGPEAGRRRSRSFSPPPRRLSRSPPRDVRRGRSPLPPQVQPSGGRRSRSPPHRGPAGGAGGYGGGRDRSPLRRR